MKILQFSFGSPGCIYYRNLNMGEVVKAHGHENIVVETNLSNVSELVQAENYIADWADIVVVTRFNDWAPIINLAREHGKHVIYEVDDTPFLHRTHPVQQIAVLNRWVERVAVQASYADAVTVSTPALAQMLRMYNDNVYHIPNMVDYSLPCWNEKSDRDDNFVVLGYFGGSSHLPDLRDVQKPILNALKKYPMLRWWYGAFPNVSKINHFDDKTMQVRVETKTGRDIIMAKNMRRLFSSVKRKKLKYLYPLDIDQYGGVYKDFDIGIVPLTDADFNRYKSNLKLLEYAAYDIPVVAKRSEPYTDVIEKSGGGILASNDAEFFAGIARLVEDKRLRKEMGKKLGDYVRSNFDLHTNGSVYLDVYEEVLSLTPKTEKAPGVPSRLGFNMKNDIEESDEQEAGESPEGHPDSEQVRQDD